MDAIVVDCTELYHNPVRTGIQRVVRELLRHWPASGPELHLAHFDGSGLARLSDRARTLLCDELPSVHGAPYDELKQRLAEAAADPVAVLPYRAAVLIPEVFFDLARARYHLRRCAAERTTLAMLAYDFLPFLQPELFKLRTAVPLMGYLHTVRGASSVAHISAETAWQYQHVVMRGCGPATGPVLPLGANGIPVVRQQWRPDRRTFVTLGSVDGRKNQHLIVAAFIQLWQAGHQIPLVLIGRVFAHVDKAWLNQALTFPQFRWLERASDADIATELQIARATLYVSTHEGFGLPPVESLAAGLPVIAGAAIPSLSMLSGEGQIRLHDVTTERIAAAVLELCNDATAARLWAACATLRLGTWQDFGARAAAWIATLPPEPLC